MTDYFNFAANNAREQFQTPQEKMDEQYLDHGEPTHEDRINVRARILLMDPEWMLDTLYGEKLMKDIGIFASRWNPEFAKLLQERLWEIACREAEKQI